MRIALLVAESKPGSLSGYAQALFRGMDSQGHRVDILPFDSGEAMKLPGYEYIVLLSETVGFFSSALPSSISKVLSTPSTLAGKKCAAFLRKRGISTDKSLVKLMELMEKEGMVVNWSGIVEKPEQAEAMAKRVG
jgi:hypothetical protein